VPCRPARRHAHPARHRRARLRPLAPGQGGGHRGRGDSGAALPCEHPARRRRHAARPDECGGRGAARADRGGAGPARGRGLSGGRHRRPHPSRGGAFAPSARRGAGADRARDSRYAGSGADRYRPPRRECLTAPGGRPRARACPPDARIGNDAREPGGGAALGPQPARRTTSRHISRGGARRGGAGHDGRDGCARLRERAAGGASAAARGSRVVPHRPAGGGEHTRARPRARGHGDTAPAGTHGVPVYPRRWARLRSVCGRAGVPRPRGHARARRAGGRAVARAEPARRRDDDHRLHPLALEGEA